MSNELYQKKEYKSVIMKALGNSPKLRIIDFFLDNPMFDFTKKEVIEALGMSKQTFYKYFPELEEHEIVEVTRRIGRAKLYRVNLKNPLVSMLREYEKKVSLQMGTRREQRLATKTVVVNFTNPVEANLYKEVCEYADLTWNEAKALARAMGADINAQCLAMTILKRRLMSSPEALRNSLKRRLEKPLDTDISTYELLSSHPKIEDKLLRSYLPDKSDYERARLKKLLDLAEKVNQSVDSKAKALLRLLSQLSEEKPHGKVIIFTEYVDTQNYLMDYLSSRVSKGSIVCSRSKKEAIEAFSRPDVKTLLMTDAKAQDLSFQGDVSTVVHYDLPWDPKFLAQRHATIDRYIKREREHVIDVYSLHLADTYESEVLERLKNMRFILTHTGSFRSPAHLKKPSPTRDRRVRTSYYSKLLERNNLDGLRKIKYDVGLGRLTRETLLPIIFKLTMGSGGLKENIPDLFLRIKQIDGALNKLIRETKG